MIVQPSSCPSRARSRFKSCAVPSSLSDDREVSRRRTDGGLVRIRLPGISRGQARVLDRGGPYPDSRTRLPTPSTRTSHSGNTTVVDPSSSMITGPRKTASGGSNARWYTGVSLMAPAK